MKKYYAREIPGEVFHYELYFTEEEAVDMKFCAFGNRDFENFNYDLIKEIVSRFETGDLLNDVDAELAKNANETPTVEEENAAIVETVRYYFHKYNRDVFTEEECYEIFKLAHDYITCKRNEENDIICKMLEMIYGVPFKHGTIHGSCQGDWMEYICPIGISDEMIDYIEAVLFGTGTEYAITEEAIDSAEEFDDADTFCSYTAKYRDEDIKEFVANEVGCEADEVVLLKISGRHTYTKYDYEEV